MNRCDPAVENTGPESIKEHLAKCSWCAEEMAEDQELMGLIQQSLWDSLAHQNPSPEVWDRIRARLPEREQVGQRVHMVWAWPRLLSDAVVVGLLIAFVGLALLRPLEPRKRGVASPTATSRIDEQTGWGGVDERGPASPREDENTAIAVLPSGISVFDAMTSKGLLSGGYLHHLKRGPVRWGGASRPGSAVAGDSGVRNPVP